MTKLKMHSKDLTQDNITKIQALFPNCVTEAQDADGELRLAVDFDLLKQELASDLVEGPQERYRLDWPGKREAMLLASSPIAKTLRPVRDESVNFDSTENLFIEGDNLEALKLLQENYLGKVKMIYIDPPYNTGSDFVYSDDFVESSEEYFERSIQVDEEGNRLVANTETNGRFHSDWLSMMLPRLRLARNLLSRDGAIFVSCDEGEQPRLRLIMDEVFGSSNMIADMVWAAGRKNDSRFVSVSHEYIVCYVKDKQYLQEQSVRWRQRKKGLDDIYSQYNKLSRVYKSDYSSITTELRAWYRGLQDGHPSKAHRHYSNVDERGVYFAADISWPGGGGPKYEVLHPITLKPVKVPSRGWMTSDPNKMQEWIDDNRVHFGEDENSVPCIKSYLVDREEQTPYSVFYQDGRAASKRLRSLMEGDFFDFPKDELVLQELIAMLTSGNDVVLDIFAGSATTAHSVLLQNALDGKDRQFIVMQYPEPCKETDKTGKKALEAGFNTIADIAKKRIRRAGKQILEGECHENWNKDVGFRVLKVDSTNMKDVYYRPAELGQQDLANLVSPIKEDRSSEDLLFQVMLDLGLELNLPIQKQTLHGKDVFFVDDNLLVACFAPDISEELVLELTEYQPLRMVFADCCFGNNDSLKTNAKQIFKQRSPDTSVMGFF